MFVSCAQNNVEASGAVEDEGLAPGGAEAGAVSSEPPRLLDGSHRVNVDSLFFCILSRPPTRTPHPRMLVLCRVRGLWFRLFLKFSSHDPSGPRQHIQVDFKVLIGVFLWNKTFNL